MNRTLYFRLGAFILLAAAALVALVLVLGTGALFGKSFQLETYFNESVQGLEVGSKVLFRGVMVGNINRIGFTYIKYELDLPTNQRKPYVLVEFNIRPELIARATTDRQTIETVIAFQVQEGLRVRQVPQGVTGLAYLELDYVDPKSNPPLAIDWTPESIYIPSTASTVGRIFGATEELVRRLGRVDVEGFVTHVNELAVTLTGKIDELQVGRLSGELVALVGELRQTNRKLQHLLDDPQLAQVPGDLSKATKDAAVVAARLRRLAESEELQKTLTQLQQTLARIDRMVAARENDVATTLNNLRQITDNLRDLSEDAKRYPSGVIFGQPPKRDPRAK